jgi:hypothetical protein
MAFGMRTAMAYLSGRNPIDDNSFALSSTARFLCNVNVISSSRIDVTAEGPRGPKKI